MNAPFNIFDEIDKETKRYMFPLMPWTPAPCRCGAYKFPHRKDGGLCKQSEIEENAQSQSDTRAQWQIDAENAGQSATGSI